MTFLANPIFGISDWKWDQIRMEIETQEVDFVLLVEEKLQKKSLGRQVT